MSLKRTTSPLIDDPHKKRGRPPNSTRMVSALLTTMSLSNIDIDLPDTPRPFHVVNTLPLSLEKPIYDDELGENLLSVKDSGSLYNSLIISRQNWLYNDDMAVFERYWSRREDLIEKANLELANASMTTAEGEEASTPVHREGTSKRKNMNKLCECALQLGPHSFDIRLFILKNDVIEKRFTDDQKAEELRTGIKIKKEADDDSDDDKELNDDKAGEETGKSLVIEIDDELREGSQSAPPGDGEEKDAGNAEEDEKTKQGSDIKKEDTEKAADAINLISVGTTDTLKKPKVNGKFDPESLESKKDLTASNKMEDSRSKLAAASIKESAKVTKKPKQWANVVKPKENVKKPDTPVIKESDLLLTTKPAAKREIQQNLENHIMIANLNSLARTNSSLNDLMKTVASGNANTKQITEFQKYIVQAKGMGDPTGSHAKTYQLQVKLHKMEQKLAEKKLRNEEKLKQQLERQKLKDLKKELRRIEKEREKEVKDELKKRRRIQRQKLREHTLERKKLDPSLKINKTKLTTLQERYLENATLAFEFSENSSSRYLFPKNCIMEKRDDELLMSFVIVHNAFEIKQFDEEELLRKAEEESAAIAKQEEPEEATIENAEPTRKQPRRRRPRYGNTRRLTTRAVKEEEPVPVVKKERPKPVYSTITVKLLEVPPHCYPLIFNSADPVENVQLEMNKIFDEGIRQEVNYVWYQLDSFTDEVLAEVLRSNLATLEAHNVKRAGGTGRRKANQD